MANFIRDKKVGDIIKVKEGIHDWQLSEHEPNDKLIESQLVYELEIKSIKKAKLTLE